MSKRPLTYGEVEDACNILEEEAHYIKHAIPTEYVRYQDGSTRDVQRDNLTTELERVDADPEEIFDYHTRPERPSEDTARLCVEKRTRFRSSKLFADPEGELERRDKYIDGQEVGRYNYGHGKYTGKFAIEHVQNKRDTGDEEIHIGIIEMNGIQSHDEDRSEIQFYPFRQVHGINHVWAFLHDFANRPHFYGDPDERVIDVWSSALVAIENDLF